MKTFITHRTDVAVFALPIIGCEHEANSAAVALRVHIYSTITCPIEVVKTQLQSSNIGGSTNPFVIAKEIMKVNLTLQG
jgi:hypothetical protein